MRTLKSFEKDLNKCSKCGLCQQACPIFELTKNDCTVSKGKFIMLHGVAKGELKLSKNINKYLDMCLKCGKCNAFCPSGIDVCQILNTAKYEYAKTSLFNKFINFLQSRVIFSSVIKIFSILSKPFRPKKKTVKNPIAHVVYFKGCVNQICPRTDNYLKKILKNLPIEVIEPDFECCGLPFLSDGNLERFEECAEYNLEHLDGDFDYIVTDCASCQDTLMQYPKYIKSANLPDNKFVNWGDLIAKYDLKFRFKKKINVTFHKPCHLENDEFLNKIMDNCENVNYIKMDNYDSCCGFAGSFALKNYKLSEKLSVQKAKNIASANVDYVITTCPACILGLKRGLSLIGCKTKVVSLVEFLAMAKG